MATNREPAPKPQATRRRPKASDPTLVLLVRHGTTSTTGSVLPGRAKGLHLSDHGRSQAEAVADRLAPLKPHALYASPMERTQETAAPIAEAIGKPLQTHDGLIECDFGEWTGKKLANLRKKPEWGTVQRHPSGFRFPDGESFSEMSARIWDALVDLRKRHPGRRVVAVSHADPIKAAVATAAGTPLDLFQRIVISPCSVTALLIGTGGPMVLAVNSLGDLSELKVS